MAKRGPARTKQDFWVVPKGASACVVVFHEVWGLLPHTEDVCKRIGKLGFAATAPNLYRGHDDVLVPDHIQRTMEAVWELSLQERRDRTKVAETLAKKNAGPEVRKVAALLYNQAFRDTLAINAISAVDSASTKFDKVATLGFCIGGGLALKAATKSRHLTSTVGFYGEPPIGDDAKKIKVPMLAVFASQDEIINQNVPAFVEAALAGDMDVTLKTYPRTKHGFFNDTRKDVYDRKSAIDSWELTSWFLEKTIGEH